MFRKSVLATAGLGAAALATAVAVAPTSTGASAAEHCTAWATLPSHVRLGNHPVTVRMTLTGSAGCHVDGVDNGATATLRGPGAKDPQRWAHFGAKDTQTLLLHVNRTGTYTLRAGDVQVYNSNDVRVPATWRSTSMVVEKG